jgi:hypothetical protein
MDKNTRTSKLNCQKYIQKSDGAGNSRKGQNR